MFVSVQGPSIAPISGTHRGQNKLRDNYTSREHLRLRERFESPCPLDASSRCELVVHRARSRFERVFFFSIYLRIHITPYSAPHGLKTSSEFHSALGPLTPINQTCTLSYICTTLYTLARVNVQAERQRAPRRASTSSTDAC